MQISDVVAAIVKQELYGNGRENEAIYFSFDVSMSHYTKTKHYKQRNGLHLLYQVNPGFTYINVFSAVTDSPFANIKTVEWKHECTHDSCWRDVNIFGDVYFGMAAKINSMLKADGLNELAPQDMHEYNINSFSKGLYRWIPVKISKDPNDKNSYWKLVQVVDMV